MSAPATTVGLRRALSLSGTLRRGDGSGVAGQRVLVQKQGTSGWVTVARATVRRRRVLDGGRGLARRGQVRARAAVTGAAAAATDGVQVGCTPLLTAKAQTTRVQGRAARCR